MAHVEAKVHTHFGIEHRGPSLEVEALGPHDENEVVIQVALVYPAIKAIQKSCASSERVTSETYELRRRSV